MAEISPPEDTDAWTQDDENIYLDVTEQWANPPPEYGPVPTDDDGMENCF